MERTQGKRKRLVVLTGAGMSAESGIMTFRDENGRWRQNDWRELACADAYATMHRCWTSIMTEEVSLLR